MNETEPDLVAGRPTTSRVPWRLLSAAVAASIATLVCYFSAYGPVLNCHAAMTHAEAVSPTDARAAGRLSRGRRRRSVVGRTVVGDRRDRAAIVESGIRSPSTPTIASCKRPSSCWRRGRVRAPRGDRLARGIRSSTSTIAIPRRPPQPSDVSNTPSSFIRTMPPRAANMRRRSQATGKDKPARREAKEAFKLDATTPHTDRKLPAQLADALKPLAAPPDKAKDN